MNHQIRSLFGDLFPSSRKNVVKRTMTMTVHTMLIPKHGAVLGAVRGGRAGFPGVHRAGTGTKHTVRGAFRA